jgi:hypothetical protein
MVVSPPPCLGWATIGMLEASKKDAAKSRKIADAIRREMGGNVA